jgi:hypothetical protein
MINRISTVFHDADALLYRNACAAVKTHYRAIYKGKDLGKVFEKKVDYNKWVKEQPESKQKFYRAEPEVHDRGAAAAYASVDKAIGFCRKKIGASNQFFYLTDDDKSNFRYEFATILPYKGNRNQEKPKYYYHVMEYLIDHWNAEVIYGEEADDKVAQEQYLRLNRFKGEDYNDTDITCIAHIDKDIDMVEGYHYDYSSGKIYWVDEVSALRHFYTQLLTGDKQTDNIAGLYQLTGHQARKPLKDPIQELTTEEEMYHYVKSVYTSFWPEEGIKATDSEGDVITLDYTVEDVLYELGNLLWMRRERGVMWKPPY